MSRSVIALALAILALVCAAVGALGPAEHLSTRYSWPPRALPAEQPDRTWYTPLLLARHEPDSISARLPCELPEPLRRAAKRATVLATVRDPSTHRGLAITHVDQLLVVSIGGDVVGQLPLSSGSPAGGDCAYELLVSDGQWSIQGGPGDLSTVGSVEAMPTVDALFSGLDLRAGTAPFVEITTTVHGTRSTIRQTAAWIIAALAGFVALLVVSAVRRPRRQWGAVVNGARQAATHARPVDALVAVVLLGWWVIGPVFYDDGWVLARQRNFSESGGFSAYYTSYGINLPLDQWLEWLEHWLFQSSSALLVLRLPALLCLAAVWVLCRWTFHRLFASSSRADRVALWAMGSAFAAVALAWGMTLRPEPVVALLVTGVLACTVRFRERETPASLAVAAVLVALALSAHPAGIVAFAPLVVAAPSLARWVRPRLLTSGAIVVAAVALLTTFVVVGSDLQQRRADAQSLRAYGDETAGWRDEINRYSYLSRSPYGAGLRRASVALILLAVLAYFLRRRRDEPGTLLDLPASALGVSLLLLLLTPTKWPWHFGALLGLAAVAVAAETARLRTDARREGGWQARPFFVIGAVMLAAAWSWFPRLAWNELDLRTLDWTLGIEERVTLAKVAGAIPLALLAALVVLELARGRGRYLHEAPWRVGAWSAPILAVPLVAFTAGVFVVDAAKTKSWTLPRQNLETLTRDLHCGLADDALVAAPSSMRALAAVSGGAAVDDDTLPPSPAEGLRRFTLGPIRTRSASARSSWFILPAGKRIGFFVGGSPSSSDTLALEWGRTVGGGVETLGVDEVTSDFESDAEPTLVPWRFFASGSLPAPRREADAVRFLLRSEVTPGAVVPLTSPVTYTNERLVDVLESRASPPLVLPSLVLYVPCARQPRLSRGVAEVPGMILGFRHSIWPVASGTSPFDLVPELYQLTRLPLTDSPEPPRDIVVYMVDRHIPGGVVAPPDETTVES